MHVRKRSSPPNMLSEYHKKLTGKVSIWPIDSMGLILARDCDSELRILVGAQIMQIMCKWNILVNETHKNKQGKSTSFREAQEEGKYMCGLTCPRPIIGAKSIASGLAYTCARFRSVVWCSWAKHFTLTIPLSTQVYKWNSTCQCNAGSNPAMD